MLCIILPIIMKTHYLVKSAIRKNFKAENAFAFVRDIKSSKLFMSVVAFDQKRTGCLKKSDYRLF